MGKGSLWLVERHPSCLPLEEEGPGVEVFLRHLSRPYRAKT